MCENAAFKAAAAATTTTTTATTWNFGNKQHAYMQQQHQATGLRTMNAAPAFSQNRQGIEALDRQTDILTKQATKNP